MSRSPVSRLIDPRLAQKVPLDRYPLGAASARYTSPGTRRGAAEKRRGGPSCARPGPRASAEGSESGLVLHHAFSLPPNPQPPQPPQLSLIASAYGWFRPSQERADFSWSIRAARLSGHAQVTPIGRAKCLCRAPPGVHAGRVRICPWIPPPVRPAGPWAGAIRPNSSCRELLPWIGREPAPRRPESRRLRADPSFLWRRA